jgi:hypothetical protein
VLATLALSAGALLGAGTVGADIAPAAGAAAHAARTIALNESAHLHRTSGRAVTINDVLNEQGSASGTIRGTIYLHLRFPAINRVSAEVNIYPSGGSISGYARASYSLTGGTASFSGSMTVNRGTGSYNHAHASGLSFSGTVQRSNDAVTVHLSGELSS